MHQRNFPNWSEIFWMKIMNKTDLIVETKRYIPCPDCGESAGSIDHLIEYSIRLDSEREFGPWYCDECGCGFKGKVVGQDVFIKKSDRMNNKEISVFLKHDDILLIVKGSQASFQDDDSLEYYYNEHTCPVNFLRGDSLQIIVDLKDNDTDPHGIFEYLGSVPHQYFGNVDIDGILKVVEGFGKDENNI